MRKVLWLCSWYPNAADPFTGDFIKRQAEAVSAIQPLKVVFAGKYTGNFQNLKETAHKLNPNLQEDILYYTSSSNHNFFSRIRSLITYFNLHREYVRQLRKED